MPVKSKATSKTTVHKLVDEQCSQPAIFAICSTESSHRLSWLLNRSLSTSLQILTTHIAENYPEISIYSTLDQPGVTVVPNKIAEGVFLAPRFKKFDYLLIYHHANSGEIAAEVEARIKRTEGVIAALLVDKVEKKLEEFLKSF